MMRANPTPRRLDVIDLRMSIGGLAELMDSNRLTAEERHLYNALALQRLEIGRWELDLAQVDLRSQIQRYSLAAGKAATTTTVV